MDMNYNKQTELYIGGQWRESETYAALFNPYDGSEIARVAQASEAHVHEAVDQAHQAFQQWKQVNVYQRSALLMEIAQKMIEKKSFLAKVMTLESGKKIADSYAEVQASIDNFIWYSEEIKRCHAEIIPSRTDSTQIVVEQPLGVVGLITPWNFPLNLVTRKLAPALAAGNAIVLKPSKETPLCAYELCKIIDEAAVPQGIVNLVTGSSSMINDVFSKRIEVRKISFTGSTQVGRSIYASGADTIKKMSLELGGNAPFIVFEDADLEKTADKLIASKKRNMGQVCTCPNRVFVHRSIKQDFIALLNDRIRSFKYGDPFLETTDGGPLINGKAVKAIHKLVEDALEKGAKIASDPAASHHSETMVSFMIVADVTEAMDIYHEEIFGPVISLIEFDTDEEVLAKANGTPYGLASYVFTEDQKRIQTFSALLEFGLVGINEIVVSTTETPFGGVKLSGFGRENGKYGLKEYMEYKFINIGV